MLHLDQAASTARPEAASAVVPEVSEVDTAAEVADTAEVAATVDLVEVHLLPATEPHLRATELHHPAMVLPHPADTVDLVVSAAVSVAVHPRQAMVPHLLATAPPHLVDMVVPVVTAVPVDTAAVLVAVHLHQATAPPLQAMALHLQAMVHRHPVLVEATAAEVTAAEAEVVVALLLQAMALPHLATAPLHLATVLLLLDSAAAQVVSEVVTAAVEAVGTVDLVEEHLLPATEPHRQATALHHPATALPLQVSVDPADSEVDTALVEAAVTVGSAVVLPRQATAPPHLGLHRATVLPLNPQRPATACPLDQLSPSASLHLATVPHRPVVSEVGTEAAVVGTEAAVVDSEAVAMEAALSVEAVLHRATVPQPLQALTVLLQALTVPRLARMVRLALAARADSVAVMAAQGATLVVSQLPSTKAMTHKAVTSTRLIQTLLFKFLHWANNKPHMIPVEICYISKESVYI